MKAILNACAALAASMALAVPVAALAAAPDDLDLSAPAANYRMETVLVVHNWILCVSQPGAERMAEANVAGADVAAKTYDDLAAAKTCGRFPKMGVMLHKMVFPALPSPAQRAGAYTASINIGVGWSQAFVVSDGTPAEGVPAN